tara:strand:+ start:479 stop:1531 length:1053 start_codon:yes stop_codon:yes gene_type:complete
VKHLKQSEKESLAKGIRLLSSTVFMVLVAGCLLLILEFLPKTYIVEFQPETLVIQDTLLWDREVFEGVDFENPALNEQVAYGRKLITKTADVIGPLSSNPFAGNNLNCSSCHLDGGGKPFAAPFVTVPSQFPQYRARENKLGTIQERVNGCMQRSMNGNPLPLQGNEMNAIVAYMEWLSYGKQRGKKVQGNKFVTINFPHRQVDLKHGEEIYTTHCQLCHMQDGQGVKNLNSFTYQYPPLWGNDSYNDGAGMHRVLTAAQFIKGNMPLGTTAERPLLTDDEAYDVAGYINSFSRPVKPKKEMDFPDRTKKPMSTPYGPWSDDFSSIQHKYGPFNEIAEFYKDQFQMVKTK